VSIGSGNAPAIFGRACNDSHRSLAALSAGFAETASSTTLLKLPSWVMPAKAHGMVASNSTTTVLFIIRFILNLYVANYKIVKDYSRY
jgi:hypothetical protein